MRWTALPLFAILCTVASASRIMNEHRQASGTPEVEMSELNDSADDDVLTLLNMSRTPGSITGIMLPLAILGAVAAEAAAAPSPQGRAFATPLAVPQQAAVTPLPVNDDAAILERGAGVSFLKRGELESYLKVWIV